MTDPAIDPDAGWVTGELDTLLPTASAVTRPHVGGAIAPGVVPTDLPKHLRERLDEAPLTGQRSEQTHALVGAAIEWGYDDGQVVAIACAHAPTVEKYGRRAAAEASRIVAKLRPEHPHVGQPCDKAGCTARPAWMTGEPIDHRAGASHAGSVEMLRDEGYWASVVADDDSPSRPAGPDPERAGTTRLLRTLSVVELDALEPPEWTVEGLVPEGGLAVLYGPPGAGKTFLALDLALHVAAGLDWQGREVRRANVLYVAAEGVGGFRQRVAAWRHAHPEANLDGFRLLPAPVNLLDRASVRALVDTARALGSRYLTADTLARCLPGADENAAKDLGLAIAALDAVRDATGSTRVIVHHTGKDGASERGSSALRGAADAMLELVAEDLRLTLTTSKQKDAAPAPALRLELCSVPEADSLAVFELRTYGNELTSKDLAALASVRRIALDEGVTATEWLASSALPKSTFYEARRKLVACGYVAKDGRGRGARYSLTPAGEDAAGD